MRVGTSIINYYNTSFEENFWNLKNLKKANFFGQKRYACMF